MIRPTNLKRFSFIPFPEKFPRRKEQAPPMEGAYIESGLQLCTSHLIHWRRRRRSVASCFDCTSKANDLVRRSMYYRMPVLYGPRFPDLRILNHLHRIRSALRETRSKLGILPPPNTQSRLPTQPAKYSTSRVSSPTCVAGRKEGGRLAPRKSPEAKVPFYRTRSTEPFFCAIRAHRCG